MLRSNFMMSLWIALGGALGSVGRYWLSGVVARSFGETFPWGTLIVNVLGSAIIGFIAVATGPDGRFLWSPALRQHVMVGVLGGFTTFSSFSLQTLELANDGEWAQAVANIALSLGLCLFGCWAGRALGVLVVR